MAKQRTHETAEYRLHLRTQGWEIELAEPFSGRFNSFFIGTNTGTRDLERAIEIAEARAALRRACVAAVDKEAAQRIAAEDQEAVDLYMLGCGRTRVEVAKHWQAHIQALGLNPLELVEEVRVRFPDYPDHYARTGISSLWKWRSDQYPVYATWVPRREAPGGDWLPKDLQQLVSTSGPGHGTQWIDETFAGLDWHGHKGEALTAALLARAHGSVPETFSTLMMASLRGHNHGVGPEHEDHTRRAFRQRSVSRLCRWTESPYHHQSTNVLPATQPWYTERAPKTFPTGSAMIEHFAIRHARLIAQWRIVLLVDHEAPTLVAPVTPEPEAGDYLQETMIKMVEWAERQAQYEEEQERRRQEQRDKRAAKKAAKPTKKPAP